MRNLEIGICLYSTSVCFGFSNRLYSLSSEKQKVRFGLQVFMQLVFGFHSVTWAVKQAGQYVPGELVLILDVLFHYKHNRIVGSDYFLEAARKFSENHPFSKQIKKQHFETFESSPHGSLMFQTVCKNCSIHFLEWYHGLLGVLMGRVLVSCHRQEAPLISATAQAAFASSSANSHRRSSKASNCLCVSVYCRSCSSTHSSDARCRDVVPCSLES
jgi:hypothetical protein